MTSEIRANKQTNRAGLGTVTYADTGIIVSGIVTCTELSGLTALNIAGVGTASTLDINGDIDVDGHTNLDNVSIAGVTTFTGNPTIHNADPILTFRDSNHSPFYYYLKCVGGSFNIEDSSNGNRMIFSANGSASVVAPTFVMTGGAQVSSNLGVTGNIIISDQIIHNGDTDTKIRFPSADTISFEIAGNEKFRLDTSGNARFGGGGTSAGTDGVHIYHASSNQVLLCESGDAYAHIGIRDNSTHSSGTYFGVQGNDFRWVTHDGSSSTEKLRITSGGVVTIGNQPKSWATAYKVLQVGAASLVGQVEGDGTTSNWSNNAYFDTTNNRWEYSGAASDQASQITQTDGLILFKTAAAGTANNALSWTETLRITSDGEVGISPGGVTPTAGDLQSGDSQNKPLIHVKGSGVSGTGGEYNLLGRFEAGGDADNTGAMIVLNHSNDRGLALIGGRATSNNAFGALKMIDNVGRLTNIMTATGYSGQGVGDIKFFTGNSTTTSERLQITGDGNVTMGNVDSSSTSALHIRSSTSTETTLELSTKDNYNGSYPSAKIVFTQINGTEIARIKCDTSTGAANMADLTFWTNFGGLYERMRIIKTGTVQIHSGSNSNGSLRIGGNYDSTGTTNSTAKLGTLMMPHYTNAEEPIQMIRGYSDSAQTLVSIGGGTSSANVATNIRLYTSSSITGTGTERLKISKHGQLLQGNTSEDQGWAVFWNSPGGGNDAGTAGNDGAGDKGVNIRSDMGPTHLDLTGTDNYTLALRNGAYSGAGVADPNGTISKILFNTVTYNGWNSYGAICLQSQGVSGARGEMVFMIDNTSSTMNEKLRIKNTEIDTANGEGLNVYGQNINHTNDAVLFAGKTGNADWCIKASTPGNDYGVLSYCGNGAAYAIGVYDGTSHNFRVRGDGVIFATNTTIQGISDVRLKENIVDANSQWDDIKALRFRNFNWKSDSGLGDGKTYLGLIAQEVEPISPNLIDLDAQTKEDIENGVPDPEYKSVKYSIVWMKAVKALQEAQARIEQLEAEVAALKGS